MDGRMLYYDLVLHTPVKENKYPMAAFEIGLKTPPGPVLLGQKLVGCFKKLRRRYIKKTKKKGPG
jgi:hypothetical protein